MTRGVRHVALTGVLVAAIAAAPATAALAVDEAPELGPEALVVADAGPAPVVDEPPVPEPVAPEPVPASVALAPLAEGDDMTVPVITVGGLDPMWVYELGSEFTLEFSCEDPESGIVSCTEEHGYASGDTVRLSVDGLNVFTVTGVNGAGISWSGSLHVWAQIPELVSVRAVFDAGRSSLNGWFDAPLAATIRAWRDDELPIREIRYRIDGGEWVVASGGEVELAFDTEGEYLLEYVAFDAEVGVSTLMRRWVALDFTAPSVFYPEDIDGAAFTVGYEKALWAECEDELSGVDVCAFDEGRWLPTDEPGEHTVTVRAIDEAGNEVTRVLRYTVLAADGGDPDADDPGTDDGAPAAPALPATGAGALASTGADAAGLTSLLLGGVALIALGAGATILTRRTRPSSR